MVFIAIRKKINAYFGQKNYFHKPKNFIRSWKINIYEYLNKFHERQKIMSEKALYFIHWSNSGLLAKKSITHKISPDIIHLDLNKDPYVFN